MSATYYPTRATVVVDPKYCPVCDKKWGRQLWVGSCVCTGAVALGFVPPGGKLERHQFVARRKVTESTDKNASVKEDLHLDADRVMTKKLKSKIDQYKEVMGRKPKA